MIMNNSSDSESVKLSVRIVKVDYYLTKPRAELKDACYSGFRSLPIYHVPVIRSFGPTSEGLKTCVHIHGVFPYIFIPNWNHELQEKDFYSFALCLDKAINTSFMYSSSQTSHVYRLTAVWKRPFYGYCKNEKQFIKIEFFNPGVVKRAADLLLNGAVFDNKYQPYGSHVPYILQFFIDNNLYGMSYLTFSSYQQRTEYSSDNFHNPVSNEVSKQTYCEFEIDTSVDCIINDMNSATSENAPNNPGLVFIWEEEKKRRRGQGRLSQITQNISQVKSECQPTRTEIYYKRQLSEKISRYQTTADSNFDLEVAEEECSSSCEELNTQGRDILLLLEKMGNESDNNSPLSSPLIVFSDNEREERPTTSKVSLLSSQPRLKISGENDSVLGNNFTDDEVDDEDHLMMSQSINFPEADNLYLDNDENCGYVSQLDGVDGEDLLINPCTNVNQKKNTSKREMRVKRTYNLRSKRENFGEANDNNDVKIFSPRKSYPQLQIDTQKSPKSSSRNSSNSQIFSADSATEILRTTAEASSSTSVAERLTSPSTSQNRKTDKRPYPQLQVSINKSPRSGPQIDLDTKTFRNRVLKRRRLDFDEGSGQINPEMNLIGTRWKKKQKEKTRKDAELSIKATTHEFFNEELPTQAYEGCKSMFLQNDSKVVHNSNGVVTMSSEIGSQKYSLKVRLNSCRFSNEQLVLKNLFTKKTLVRIDRMKEAELEATSNSNQPLEVECSDTSTAESSQWQKFNVIKKPSSEIDFSHYSSSHKSSESLKSCALADDSDTVILSKSSYSSENSDCLASLDIHKPTILREGSNNFNPMATQDSGGSDNFPNLNLHKPFPLSPAQEEIIRISCKYGSLGDNKFSFQTVELDEQSLKEGTHKQRLRNEGISFLSSLEMSSPIIDDDDDDLINARCGYDPENEENFQKLPSAEDGMNVSSNLDSSIKGDECPNQKLQPIERNSPQMANESKESLSIPFSQNSDDDQAFAEFSFSQITSDRVQPMIMINHESSSLLQSKKQVDESSAEEFAEMKFDVLLDNSIWDSVDSAIDDNGDEKIQSFYSDKSVNAINATIFSQVKDEDVNSSFEAEQLSQQSDDKMCSLDDAEKNRNTKAQSISPVLLRRSSEGEVLVNDDSPEGPKQNVPHSTPQSIKRKKKSPSPTYTPILKKLILKRMSGERSCNKSKAMLRCFQIEKPLRDIKEEEEIPKIVDVGDKSGEVTATTSADINSSQKGLINTNYSSNSIGSGQIDITMSNTFGFRMSLENLQNVKADIQPQYITTLSVELFATTRGDLNPDPEIDPIHAIFYSIFHDDPTFLKIKSGVIIVDCAQCILDLVRFDCEKVFVKDEQELFDSFVTLMRKWDPDILIGYEVEMLSWGYIIQRGHFLGRNFDTDLSRVIETKTDFLKDKTIVEDSEFSEELKLPGRIILNIWRLMRHEIALQSYSFENILFHVLHQRVPRHSFHNLTECWRNPSRRWIVIDYYLFRVEGNILLLQQLDFIGRTSELARLFGIQFYEVLSRGSQFRVESMMLRLAKKENFVAVSPSVKQRAAMRAPECIPLIMEPESKFYTDPVIVLDFQSLYPSIIVAYNYCFSTCLGRVEFLADKETFKLGCIQHTVTLDMLRKLEPFLNISPCGVAFVNKDVRTGVLPSLLQEILDTRLMVKKSMKENKEDRTLQRVLHARQLGLKLIANVTYGYTSANFSGRMPCIEVGDSVVSKGRETLQRVIEMVTNNEKWAAKVIYGDTDSLFVLVPNRTKGEAFRIGIEIVNAVSDVNPKPVKLKLEKVYYPCILQAKKRYVGYMYEGPDQKEPIYDAKGIETVRRDGCPAVSKILEKSLKLLFDHKNVDVVKRYVQRQFSKVIAGRLSIQELTFAREYRGMHNYKPAACVPALQLARQAILRDRRSEPRVKERVRYVLTAGPPGVPLIQLVRTPEEFLNNPGLIINTEYYITRAIIPALERCFSLMNVDVRSWYSELPRKQRLHLPIQNDIKNKTYKKKTISHYFTTSKCIACEQISVASVCKECQKNTQKLALNLGTMVNKLQRKFNYVEKICRSCCGRNDLVECSSLDCPVYYNYRQAMRDVEQVPHLQELQETFLQR